MGMEGVQGYSDGLINEKIRSKTKRKVSGQFKHLVGGGDDNEKSEEKGDKNGNADVKEKDLCKAGDESNAEAKASQEGGHAKVPESNPEVEQASEPQSELEVEQQQEKEHEEAQENEAVHEPLTKPEVEALIKSEKAKQRYRKTSQVFSTDRGRLFVRIMSLENIQMLSDIDMRNAKVSMILDNGLHSITTPYKTMNQEGTRLDHEFELVVGESLNFILTFRAKWAKTEQVLPSPRIVQASPNSVQASPKTESPGANLLRSPGARVTSSGPVASTLSQNLKPTPSIASSTVSSKKRHGFSKLFGRNKSDKDKKANIGAPIVAPVQSARLGNVSAAAAAAAGRKSIIVSPQSRLLPVAQSPASHQVTKKIPDPWDRFVAADGSFARAFVSLSQYEQEVYGVAKQVSIACFNEWTTEVTADNSNPSQSPSLNTPSEAVTKRRNPYPIAKLTCQLMFIPRGRADESLPTSIEEAQQQLDLVRKQIAEAKTEEKKEKEVKEIFCEGYLSQLGGDCRYWRRRHFKLDGSRLTLTAYSDSSHKPRVSINLRKAVEVVKEKKVLVQPTTSWGANNSKARRQSAFAEQEEGHMFVNEGFRIRFANGEIIDFYSESLDQKQAWVSGLRHIIESTQKAGDEDKKGPEKKAVELKPWMEQVLANEQGAST